MTDDGGSGSANVDKYAGTPDFAAQAIYLAIPAALLFVLLLRPISDVDIFWQLRLGEMILHHGGPITREPFAATHLGEALPSLAWLGQAAFAGARLLGGWTGLRVFDAIIWLGGYWVVSAACLRRGAAPIAGATALAVGVIAALPAASIRPQSFAAVGFGLLLALLRLELSPLRTLLLALPLFVLWQNLHPSVSVAVIVLSAAAGAAWARFLFGHRSGRPWLFTALAGLAAISMFATPDGFSIIAVSAENAKASVVNGANEWLPIWTPVNHKLALLVAVAALVTGWQLVRNWRRVNPEELAPAVVLFVMTLIAYRFVLFWSIALVPVLTRTLSVPGQRQRKSWATLIITTAALSGAIGLALLVRPTQFLRSMPLAGVKRLHEAGVKGTVFASPPWGGPLIDAGYPDWTVAYDGRYYRYTPQEWRRYRLTIQGKVGPDELDRIYHPAAYLLTPGTDDALIAALRAEPRNWREIYADRTCVVFVREPAQPAQEAS
ncbi:MAG: hypothetical protein ACREEB_09260 [Caulobacteraceae bacterium]